MTATSLTAASQSARDRRFPLRTSISEPAGRRSIIASIPAISLEGLTKQTTLRNPRSSKLCSTRDPMKPAAPVIRIRSSGPTMKPSCCGKALPWLAKLVAELFISPPRRECQFQIFPRQPCQHMNHHLERRSSLTSANYGFAIAKQEDCRVGQPQL